MGFKGLPCENFGIIPSEIECEAVYHNNLMAIYLSDHCKFFRIRPSEIEFQSDFSKFVFNSYQLLEILRIRPLRLNLGVISAVITVFIIHELSDCRKF